MQEIDEQVALLLYKRISGEELEAEEHAALDSWLAGSAHHRALLNELLDEARLGKDVKALLEIDEDAALKKLQRQIALERRKARIVSPVFVRYAAVAIVVAASVLAVYFIYGGSAGKGQPKKDAFYNYNLVITPRKKTSRQVSSNGSIVWTNAATKLGYSKEAGAAGRTMVVEGEAYFEIMPKYDGLGNKVPFWVIIAKNGIEQARIEVLGTEFNVSAYPEEDTIRITLVKGKILLQPANKDQATSLLPGQMAELGENGAVRLGKADTAQNTGWKNHKFIFDKKGIRPIMRMIERWYDVPVQFDTKTEISVSFTGTPSSDVPVSELLNYMELTGNVHFVMKGDTIVVQNPQP